MQESITPYRVISGASERFDAASSGFSADPRAGLPAALLVTDDERCRHSGGRALLVMGFRPIVVPTARRALAALAFTEASLVLLDARRELGTVARVLIELSRREQAPTTVLLADDDELAWVADRFGLLTGDLDDDAALDRAVERSLRETRRPLSAP